jgi:ABC-2 type transport system ATP-binding protein
MTHRDHEQQPAIEAQGLAKTYGALRVLDGVDLTVPRGTVFALLGPNGAGKTTTVRILATLLRPDAGRANVAGFDIARERRHVRRSISLTGQNVAIDELQTGEENLRMMARLTGLTGRQSRRRADELLERFDLHGAAGRRVATYSGGMRRRLDLASGLVGHPSVIFLDEPTTGLDLHSRQAMWEVIAEQVRTGVSVLLTTQYLEEADQLADTIAVVEGGRVVATGTPAALKQQIADQRLDLTLADDGAFRQVVDRLGRRVITADPIQRVVSVPTDGAAAGIRGLLDEVDPGGGGISRFAVHTATLDDVFLALTGSRPHRPDTDRSTTGRSTTDGTDRNVSEPAHV